MNILKILRKPYLAMFLASVMLVFSCEKDSLNNPDNEFDYTVFNEFVKQGGKSTVSNYTFTKDKSDTVEEAKKRLQDINKEYGTDIAFPDEFLAMTDLYPGQIEANALKNGWLNENDTYLMDAFMSDLDGSTFNDAIKKFETNVMNLDLSEEEFQEKNLVVNSLKSLNEFHPEVFSSKAALKGGWGCVRSVVALVISSVALASCVTIIACGLAVSAWIISYASYVDNCKD